MKPVKLVLRICVLVLFLVLPLSLASAYDAVIGRGQGSQGAKTSVTVSCETSDPVRVTFIYTDGTQKIVKMSKNTRPKRSKRLKAIIIPGGKRKEVKNGEIWIIKD